MTHLTASKAQKNFNKTLHRVKKLAEEDRLDLEEARKALAEPGKNKDWNTLKREIGL